LGWAEGTENKVNLLVSDVMECLNEIDALRFQITRQDTLLRKLVDRIGQPCLCVRENDLIHTDKCLLHSYE